MAKTVKISDGLAALLEERRRADGHASVDETAEALIARGLALESDDDHFAGRDDETLRRLIDEADASGPSAPWDPKAAREEVLRRYAARNR